MSARPKAKKAISILIAAVLLTVIALFTFSCSDSRPADQNSAIPSNTQPGASNTVSPDNSVDPNNAAANTDNQHNAASNDAAPGNTASNTAEPANNSGNDKASPDLHNEIETNTNENNIVLTETKYADRSYIDETLFLGDSNTARYLDYTDAQGKPYVTVQNTIGIYSMGIEHIQALPCMSFATGTFTVPASVSMLQPRRMMIMFGTNNLKDYGVQGAEAFAEYYAGQIRAISDAYPDADIIINTVLPATQNTIFMSARMDIINAFNQAIEKMCMKNGWRFLNSFEVFTDDTGYADPELFDSDGIHLNQKGVDKMFDYIRRHALYTEDRRSMPLNEIPKINGPLIKMLLG